MNPPPAPEPVGSTLPPEEGRRYRGVFWPADTVPSIGILSAIIGWRDRMIRAGGTPLRLYMGRAECRESCGTRNQHQLAIQQRCP